MRKLIRPNVLFRMKPGLPGSLSKEYIDTILINYIEGLEEHLAECYRLSGADPDGDEDWRIATSAVKEVTRLRQEYQDLEEKESSNALLFYFTLLYIRLGHGQICRQS